MPTTRRRFCATAALLAVQPRLLRAQAGAYVDVAVVERDRVLSEAAVALKQPLRTITGIHSPASDPHEFYSEADAPKAFRAHAEALIDASTNISTLTAAYVLTRDDKYALRAGAHFYAWFVDPATCMKPDLQSANATATNVNALAAGMVDGVPLAEIARSLPFLADTAALAPPDLATTRAWFTSFLEWLNTSRIPVIARDTKDHTASAWLLLAASIGRLLGDEATLNACRHRFKTPTLRNQIDATGVFHHEVVTDAPYRNSLFNYDLLAGACELLSTPFASLWTYELEDGPGLRSVAAFLYPMIHEPARWPYPADTFRFREVPRRRPALLLAGRAYTRPEYVDLWRSLPQPPADDPLRASFPIRQPLLWTARAPHNA
ncbi:MAG TPA: alginate lyase family protein [Acidobacteriaceae bacterium]|nr:alginate lyase family protein [Acidobacteriaceae bacterium]